MPQTLSDEDLGIGSGLSDADVGIAPVGRPLSAGTSLNLPTPRSSMELAAQNYLRRQETPGLPAEGVIPSADTGKQLTEPRLNLPEAVHEEGEPFLTTVGKEGYNIAKGIPEFLSSDVGIASVAAGGIAPKVIAGIFSGTMFKDIGQQIVNNYKNWDKMSETQKRVAMLRLLGTGLFAGFTGKASVPKFRPAIKLVGGGIVEGKEGQVHNDVIAENKLGTEDIDQRGFVDEKGQWNDRAQTAAQVPGIKTEIQPATPTEPAQAHASEVAEAQEKGGEPEKVIPPISKLSPPPSLGSEGGLVGMGGALAEGEIVEGTALKNAVGEMERVGLGLPEAYPTVRQNMARAWIRAGDHEAKNPGAGAKLADDLIQNPERGLTDEESALLLRHKVSLFNEMNDAAEATHTATGEAKTVAQNRYAKLADDYTQLLDAVKFRGSQWGREGRWRQAMAREDYDFSTTDGLQRYYRQHTGEDLPAAKLPAAEKISKAVKTATDAETEARTKVLNEIDQGGPVPVAEKRAWDAANKTVREHAIRMAKAENKAREQEQKIKTELDDLAGKHKERIESASTERDRNQAIQKAKAETDARVRAAESKRASAKVQMDNLKRIQGILAERERKAGIKAAEAERKLQADPLKRVWDKSKVYLEQGIDDFDDLRNKVATDLGMKADQVARLLAQQPKIKYLADDLWRKQQDARRLREIAKRWLTNQMTPLYQRAISSVPKILFSLKVGFHGTVALGTHAPMVAFQPRFWEAYVRDFGKMYRMVGAPTPKGQRAASAYYEMQVQDLLRRKNYTTARRGGLINDPFVFEDFNSPDTSKYFGKITGMGNRGYTVLKILRQDMFDQMWDKLPQTSQIPEVAEALADGINHATGVVKAKSPTGAHVVLFAPRLEASRAAWLVVDPVKSLMTLADWKNATPGERAFAINQWKEKAWVGGTVLGLLALNQGFLAATGSKQKINMTDPYSSDFLKFKAAGMDIGYGNAMITMARLGPQLVYLATRPGGKLKNLIYPDEDVYTTVGKFIRSQLSPFAGTAADLLFRSDYQRRPLPGSNRPMPKRLREQGIQPYTWPEYTIEALSFIPLQEAIKEVWRYGLGMSQEKMKAYSKGAATIIFMGGTGARVTEDIPKKQAQPYYVSP